MGSFWLVLLFMGIAALVKRHEAVAEGKTNTSGAPTNDEQEEIQRRIREILGELQPATERNATPRPAAERRVVAQKQPSQQRRTKTPKPQSGATSHQISTSLHSRIEAKPSASKSQPQPTTSNPTPAKSEVENIVEDFSLEKAVIYAEILEPKYKEY